MTNAFFFPRFTGHQATPMWAGNALTDSGFHQSHSFQGHLPVPPLQGSHPNTPGLSYTPGHSPFFAPPPNTPPHHPAGYHGVSPFYQPGPGYAPPPPATAPPAMGLGFQNGSGWPPMQQPFPGHPGVVEGPYDGFDDSSGASSSSMMFTPGPPQSSSYPLFSPFGPGFPTPGTPHPDDLMMRGHSIGGHGYSPSYDHGHGHSPQKKSSKSKSRKSAMKMGRSNSFSGFPPGYVHRTTDPPSSFADATPHEHLSASRPKDWRPDYRPKGALGLGSLMLSPRMGGGSGEWTLFIMLWKGRTKGFGWADFMDDVKRKASHLLAYTSPQGPILYDVRLIPGPPTIHLPVSGIRPSNEQGKPSPTPSTHPSILTSPLQTWSKSHSPPSPTAPASSPNVSPGSSTSPPPTRTASTSTISSTKCTSPSNSPSPGRTTTTRSCPRRTAWN